MYISHNKHIYFVYCNGEMKQVCT